MKAAQFVLLCAALFCFAAPSFQKHTLNVDYVYPSSQAWTKIDVFNAADITNVDRLDVTLFGFTGKLDDITVDTAADIVLAGTGVTLKSGTDVNINTQGSAGFVASSTLTVAGDNLDVESYSFSASTSTHELVLDALDQIVMSADSEYIRSDGPVDLISGNLATFFADDAANIQGQDTVISGDNRISLNAVNDLTGSAANFMNTHANIIDFDALGDIDITATDNNVNLFASHTLFVESNEIDVNANRGVDVTSTDSQVLIKARTFTSNSASLDFNAADDVLWKASKSAKLTLSSSTNIAAEEKVSIVSENLSVAGKTYTLDGEHVSVNGEGNIVFTLSPGTSSISATQYLSLNSDIITSTSRDLTLSTSAGSGDVIVDTDGQGSILFQTANYNGQFLARDNFLAQGGANDWIVSTSTKINGKTLEFDSATGLTDTLSVLSPTITMSSKTLASSAFTTLVQAQTKALSVNSFNMNLNAGADTDDFVRFITQTTAQTYTAAQGNLAVLSEGNTYFSSAKTLLQAARDIYFGTPSATTGDVTFSSSKATYTANTAFFDTTGVFSISALSDSTFTLTDSATFNSLNDATFAFGGSTTFTQAAKTTTTITATNVDWNSLYNHDLTATGSALINGDWNVQSGYEFTGASNFQFTGAWKLDAGAITVEATTATGSIKSTSTSLGFTAANSFDDTASRAAYSAFKALTATTKDIFVRTGDEYDAVVLGTDITFTMGLGDSYAITDKDIEFFTDAISFTGKPIFIEGTQSVYSQSRNTYTTTENSLSITSAGSASFIAEGNLLVQSNGGITANAAYDFISATGDLTINANNFLKFTTPGTTFWDADHSLTFTIGGNLAFQADDFVTRHGTLTSTTTNGSSFKSQTAHFLSGRADTFTATTDITFNGDVASKNGVITFKSDDLSSSSTGATAFNGGYILAKSGEAQNIRLTAAKNVLYTSQNNSAITVTSRDDINTTAAIVNIISNGVDNGVGISLLTTHANADILSYARNGKQVIEALTSAVITSGGETTLFAADTVFIETQDAIGGGISFLSTGSEHDEVFGGEAGASFRTNSDAGGVIALLSIVGQAYYNAGKDIHTRAGQGAITLTAGKDVSYTATNGTMNMDALYGTITLTADVGDITATAAGNLDINSFGVTNIISTEAITLKSTGANETGIAFASDNSNIYLFANADSDIKWTAPLDLLIESGQQTTFYAHKDITMQGVNGEIDVEGETGIGLVVTNGDLNVLAFTTINITSDTNNDVEFISGKRTTWTGRSTDISVESQGNVEIFSHAGNVVYQTLDSKGDINVNSQGSIRFQSQGTNNNPGGGNSAVDGIYVIAPKVSASASKQIILDSEGIFTIGATTRPTVTVKAGGDAGQAGITAVSEGNIHLTSRNNLLVNPSDDYIVTTAHTFDMETVGTITIESKGTSTEGRDVTFTTVGEMTVTSRNAQLNGFSALSLVSQGSLKLNSNENSIQVISATQEYIDVNRTLNIDAAQWTVNTNTYNFFALGDVTFTSTQGNIVAASQAGLTLASDLDMNLVTNGNNAPISITTSAANSKLTFETNAETANLAVLATNNKATFSSVNLFNIDAYKGVVLGAIDTDLDNVQNGNVVFNAQDDLGVTAQGALNMIGVQGVTVAATNPAGAKMAVNADGKMVIESAQNMNMNSLTGDVQLVSSDDIILATHPGDGGDIFFDSTRGLTLNAAKVDGTTEIFGDMRSVVKGVIHLQTQIDDMDFIANSTSSVFSMRSEQGKYLASAFNDFLVFGKDQLHEADVKLTVNAPVISYVQFGTHSPSTVVSEQGFVRMVSTNTINVGSFENELFQGSSTQHINSYGTAINPSNPLQTVGIAAVGSTSVQLVSNDAVRTLAKNAINWVAPAITISSTDANTQLYRASGANSVFNIKATGASAAFTTSGNSVTFDSESALGGFLDVQSNPNSIRLSGNGGDEDANSLQFITTHPDADIQVYASDFLQGSNKFSPTNTLHIQAYEDVFLATTDDDDTLAVGSYQIFSRGRMDLTGRSVNMESVSNGDVVVRTINSGNVHLSSADDITAIAREQLQLRGNNVFATASKNVRIRASGNGAGISLGNVNTPGPFTIAGNSFGAFSAGTQSWTSQTSISIQAGLLRSAVQQTTFNNPSQHLDINANTNIVYVSPTISFTTRDKGIIDFPTSFRPPIVFPAGGDLNTGAACLARQMFYQPLTRRLCYCLSVGTLQCFVGDIILNSAIL